ncbi:MAG: 30S ribosomal protein S2 [Candidatus Amesbacteria bacterium GW2011_GWA2_42_12]|uniref:Small ribosomal subunit protein uS2 n=1 Tax=Candidatus Amesbacteria bacterium GW2011_GWA2_42_12 TaxID=1618356 RepID=A0A0G1B656_9BACT|nr:MAG: 30S ribosomal protein S2 [Candidatus Amesbacteria bacterium GW2011_GWA2_42_12]
MTDISLQQLLEAGCHFGHQSRRWNPTMNGYIYGVRDGVHIFDLVKTKKGLDEAAAFVETTASQDEKILMVGTKRQARGIVEEAAKKVGMPFVAQRWLGGMLTNFAQLQKSVKRLKSLKDRRDRGELKKYTKKEQLDLDREIAKLERFLGGVADMDKLPAAMFVVDTHHEIVAVKEAVRAGIPVVGIVDTNAEPSLVDYVIPANDDAVKSIELILGVVVEAIFKGTKEKTKNDKSKSE